MVLVRKPASATEGGELTDGAQTIAGDKTFSGDTTVSGTLDAAGGFAGTGGLATSTQAGLVYKNELVARATTAIFSAASTDNVLVLTKVPQGTYRVTVGAQGILATTDKHAFIEPQVNSVGMRYLNQLAFNVVVGMDTTGLLTNENNVDLRTPCAVGIVDFPLADTSEGVGTNRFHLTINTADAGTDTTVSAPSYALERIGSVDIIGSEWD